MPTYPLGGVFPARETHALKSFAQVEDPNCPPISLVQIESAQTILERQYLTDAHFVTYYPQAQDGAFPRAALSLLPEIRERGSDLVCAWWVLEVDNAGHEPHVDPAQARSALQVYWETLTPSPHAAYTTRGGYRFLWQLSEPLPVDESAARRRTFARRTLPEADPSTLSDDWTRLWRAPAVTRDGSPQWVQAYYVYRCDFTRPPVDPRAYDIRDPLQPQKTYVPAAPIPPRPSDEEAADLLDTLYAAPDRRLESELRRRALGRTPLEPTVFRHEPLAPEGGPGRSNAIHKIAGQAAAFFSPLAPNVTPQLAYALLWPSVFSFNGEFKPGVSWLDHLWEALCTYWHREIQSNPSPTGHLPIHVAPIIREQRSLLGEMIEGVSKWAPPDFPKTFDDQQLWIQNHLMLISTSKEEIYLLRRDGYYDPQPVQSLSLIPTIRKLGLDALIPLSTIDGKQRSAASLIRDYSIPFLRKKLFTGILSKTGIPGGMLHPVPGHANPELHISLYARRTDLEPTFDPQIDEWFKVLAADRYPDLIRWLSYVLAFEEGPICAMAMHGAPSVGKKMLVRGLTECMQPEGFFATGKDFGKFNNQLLESPFLVIDEGFPSSIPLEDRANRFRNLMDGSAQDMEAKYQGGFKAYSAVRVIFTANNTTFADALTGGRELSPEDEQAIAQRVLIIPARDSARVWLEARGGIQFTRGWVAPDGASPAHDPGEYRVARHILHLYNNRHQYRPGERWLVQGRTDDQMLLRQMQTRNEHHETILEALLDMTELMNHRPPDGMIYREEVKKAKGGVRPRAGLFVSAAAVIDQIRIMARRTGIRIPSQKAVTRSLAKFSKNTGCRIEMGNHTRYSELNLEMLVEYGEELGRPTSTIREMIEGAWHPPRVKKNQSIQHSLAQPAEAEKIN